MFGAKSGSELPTSRYATAASNFDTNPMEDLPGPPKNQHKNKTIKKNKIVQPIN